MDYLLENPELRQWLRGLGSQALRQPEHTYTTRLQTMLKWSQARGISNEDHHHDSKVLDLPSENPLQITFGLPAIQLLKKPLPK